MTQIKIKQHCLCTKFAQYKSNSCECENKLCTRAGMGLMWVTCQANSDIQNGTWAEEAPAAHGRFQAGIPWEMAPASSLWSFCSCPSETPGVPQMVLLPCPRCPEAPREQKTEEFSVSACNSQLPIQIHGWHLYYRSHPLSPPWLVKHNHSVWWNCRVKGRQLCLRQK